MRYNSTRRTANIFKWSSAEREVSSEISNSRADKKQQVAKHCMHQKGIGEWAACILPDNRCDKTYRWVMGAANYHLPSGDAQTKSAHGCNNGFFFPRSEINSLVALAVKREKNAALFECPAPFIDSSAFYFLTKLPPRAPECKAARRKSAFWALWLDLFIAFSLLTAMSGCVYIFVLLCVRAGDVHLGKRSVGWLPEMLCASGFTFVDFWKTDSRMSVLNGHLSAPETDFSFARDVFWLLHVMRLMIKYACDGYGCSCALAGCIFHNAFWARDVSHRERMRPLSLSGYEEFFNSDCECHSLLGHFSVFHFLNSDFFAIMRGMLFQ